MSAEGVSKPTVFDLGGAKGGATVDVIPINRNIKVSRVRDKAFVTGFGMFLLVDIDGDGMHRCKLYNRRRDGLVYVVDSVGGSRYCPFCDEYNPKGLLRGAMHGGVEG
jgi:hypothetical protein